MKSISTGIGTGFVKRREFLRSGATLLAATSIPAVVTTASAAVKTPDSMLYPGEEDALYGGPSKHEKHIARKIFGQTEKKVFTWSYTPIENQRGVITPSGLHFGSHHSGVHDIEPNTHELYIHGMTKKALKFAPEDLLRYPMSNGIKFLECSGNTWAQGAMPEAAPQDCQMLYGLISGSEWTGVSVKTLLQEAGVDPKAKWVIAEGADTGSLARSIPLSILMNDAIIALYQNGERLRPEQGYPMRLFIPGVEGNMNIKWIRRLEVTDQPAYTKDESRAYTETLADGSIEGFSMYMGVKSVITHPSAGRELHDKGFYEVSGLAWSGFGKIKHVEVSDDGGETWHRANIDGPVLSKSLTRFSLPWKWNGKEVRLKSRAVDELGNIQPTHSEWKQRYLPGSYNHYNAIQTWLIKEEGSIHNVF
jgi:sulfane dehydrogenase subunit SoxC